MLNYSQSVTVFHVDAYRKTFSVFATFAVLLNILNIFISIHWNFAFIPLEITKPFTRKKIFVKKAKNNMLVATDRIFWLKTSKNRKQFTKNILSSVAGVWSTKLIVTSVFCWKSNGFTHSYNNKKSTCW